LLLNYFIYKNNLIKQPITSKLQLHLNNGVQIKLSGFGLKKKKVIFVWSIKLPMNAVQHKT